MGNVTLNELRELCDFDARRSMVSSVITQALASPAGRAQFFGRYTSWNGFFGSGVAALAGSRRVSMDRDSLRPRWRRGGGPLRMGHAGREVRITLRATEAACLAAPGAAQRFSEFFP